MLPVRVIPLLTVFLCSTSPVSAWQQYATPLQVATAQSDGTYWFDFDVRRKLTMAFAIESNHLTPVDYYPDSQSWESRDSDQLQPCDKTHPLPSNSPNLTEVLMLDGLHRRIISINGETPGVPLVVPLGAEVVINVHNNLLMDGFSIHMHGLDKRGLWFTDGVSYVQQCPIPVGTTYQYRFIADTPGTHWYHGHQQTDRGDGLLGGLIVVNHDGSFPDVPIDLKGTRAQPSRQYSLIMQDYGQTDMETSWADLDEKTMKWMYGFDGDQWKTQCWQPTHVTDGSNLGGAVPLSAILFNSKGWYNQTDVMTRPHVLPLETFLINETENIVIRIVNGGVAQEFLIHIPGHNLTIVAADGREVVPFTIDYLIIFPGERYDILIQGLANPSQRRYHIIAETIQYYWWDWNRIYANQTVTYGVAFLEYQNASLPDITTPPDLAHGPCLDRMKANQPECTVFNCPFRQFPNGMDRFPFTCFPVDALQSNEVIEDKEILQNTSFTSGYEEHFINMHFDSHVNGFMYKNPVGMPYYWKDNLDAVSTDCSKQTNCTPALVEDDKYNRACECFYHLKHKLGNIVQMTIYNMGVGGTVGQGYAHPVHIHGTHYYVMKVGYPTYNGSGFIDQMNSDFNCKPTDNCDNQKWANQSWLNGALPGMNTQNPSIRDTITLPVGGYITVRFRATNPGWWFAHCHLTLHLMGGTAYAFQVGEDADIPPPPENFPHSCGRYIAPPLGSPASTTPASSTKPTGGMSSPRLPSLLLLLLVILISRVC